MRKISSIIWGILLIIVGVILATNALDITNIEIFFDGWWTLFIIIPCFIGLFTEREKTDNVVGVAIGIILLLCCQGILSFDILWKILLPVVIIIAGIKILLKGIFNKTKTIKIITEESAGKRRKCSAVFSGFDLKCDGEIFEGADVMAVFGGVECDLRNAIIEKDCVIQVSAVFGGVDVIVPTNVNVKVDANCIFGGISNKTSIYNDAPTIYVSGLCMFGGVDIK